jgi:hypothetical protein
LAARSRKRRFSSGAAEQLHQQRAPDIKRLVHVGVHARVHLQLPPGGFAQDAAQPPRDQDRQGQDQHADQRQPPLEREHHPQHHRGLDGVGDDVDDGVRNRILGADHIVVQPAHQLAHLGVGEEPQRHALQLVEQRRPQVVDHPFADPGVEPPLEHARRAVQDRDEEQPQRQQEQPVKVARREHTVDHLAEDQRRDQRQRRGEQDQQQHAGDRRPIRARIRHHAKEQRAGHLGPLILRIQNRHPA